MRASSQIRQQHFSKPASALTAPHTETGALLELGRWLRAQNYAFSTVTPETMRRVNARAGAQPARDLREVFGWSRPFAESLLPPAARWLLAQAGALQRDGFLWRSALRFSTLESLLFAHSAYPTLESDSVFFGPDTCRFARFIRAGLSGAPQPRVRGLVDIGCGAGAGGIIAAPLVQPERLLLTDINPKALRYASVNAALAGVRNAQCLQSDVLQAVAGPIDLIVANPPYLSDAHARLYRDGGGALGCDLSVRIVEESLERLEPGGRLLLYSGAPVVAGEDRLWRALSPLLSARALRFHYSELDPDVFGEELEQPAYAQVERIAAVGLSVTLP